MHETKIDRIEESTLLHGDFNTVLIIESKILKNQPIKLSAYIN